MLNFVIVYFPRNLYENVIVSLSLSLSLCLCVCACVRAHVCACVCACVRVTQISCLKLTLDIMLACPSQQLFLHSFRFCIIFIETFTLIILYHLAFEPVVSSICTNCISFFYVVMFEPCEYFASDDRELKKCGYENVH